MDWIPPRREILFSTHRSYSEEKSGKRAPIPPPQKIGWENRKATDP